VHCLSQPFLTTEPFSGVPGAWVRVDEMLDDVEALLAGAVDRVPPAELSYLGSLNRRD
jgi:F0F1-type ATP synthase beta subunit